MVKKTGRFAANLFINGRNKRLGSFETPEAGHKAYVEAKRAEHAGCTL